MEKESGSELYTLRIDARTMNEICELQHIGSNNKEGKEALVKQVFLWGKAHLQHSEDPSIVDAELQSEAGVSP